MAGSDTQDWYRFDISQNFRIERRHYGGEKKVPVSVDTPSCSISMSIRHENVSYHILTLKTLNKKKTCK